MIIIPRRNCNNDDCCIHHDICEPDFYWNEKNCYSESYDPFEVCNSCEKIGYAKGREAYLANQVRIVEKKAQDRLERFQSYLINSKKIKEENHKREWHKKEILTERSEKDIDWNVDISLPEICHRIRDSTDLYSGAITQNCLDRSDPSPCSYCNPNPIAVEPLPSSPLPEPEPKDPGRVGYWCSKHDILYETDIDIKVQNGAAYLCTDCSRITAQHRRNREKEIKDIEEMHIYTKIKKRLDEAAHNNGDPGQV